MRALSFCEFEEQLLQSEEGTQYLQTVDTYRKEERGLLKESGFEIHHIHPRGLGGDSKSGSNLIKVTIFEHCVLHVLLARAIPCLETLSPVIKMTYRQVKELSDLDRIDLEEVYHWSDLRKQARRSLSQKHSGTTRLYDPRDNYRWVLVRGPEEVEAKLKEGFLQIRKVCMCNPSEGLRKVVFPWQVQELREKGWVEGSLKRGPASEETRRKLSESHKGGTSHLGIPVSPETRARIAETLRRKGCRPPSSKGKKRVYLPGSNRFTLVLPDKVEEYLNKGYEIRKKVV